MYRKLFSIRVLLLALFCLLVPIHALAEAGHKHYLTICAIFQNEAQWIKEWIEYHQLVGVDHFRLYNHHSTDEWEAILQPYIESGLVEVIDWCDRPLSVGVSQKAAYNSALRQLRTETTWLAFIDLDEFLVPVKHDSLPAFLEPLEKYGGVVLNWKNFGTSGVESLAPGELLIEMLRWSVPPDGFGTTVVKSIVRPIRAIQNAGVHRFIYRKGYFAVDANGDRSGRVQGIPNWRSSRSLLDTCCIHHYKLRTREWAYGEKARRLAQWRHTTVRAQVEKTEEFDRRFSKQLDHVMERFVPRLRERMFSEGGTLCVD